MPWGEAHEPNISRDDERLKVLRPLRVGDVLEGFCNGYFGRDSYDDKTVEAIGADWVVVRHSDSRRQVVLATGDPEDLVRFRR